VLLLLRLRKDRGLLAPGHLQILHESFAVPPDLIRCFPFNGLQRSPRATLLPPGRVRPETSRCSTSRTACDLPVLQFDRGLSASSGDTAMRYTLSSCTPLPCTLSPCTALPTAGLALASALPRCRSLREPSLPSYCRARLSHPIYKNIN
jgi:hypothetical protein